MPLTVWPATLANDLLVGPLAWGWIVANLSKYKDELVCDNSISVFSMCMLKYGCRIMNERCEWDSSQSEEEPHLEQRTLWLQTCLWSL